MIKTRSLNEFFIKLFFVWVYITALIYSIYTLSFTWAYQGINFYQQPIWVYTFIYIFSLIPVPFLPQSLKLPSDYINIYLYVFTFIPSVTVPFFITKPGLFNTNYIIYLVVFLISLLYLLYTPNSSKNKKNIISLIKPIKKELQIPIFVLIYFFALALFVSTFGFKFSIPTLSDVYDVRAQYKEVTGGSLLTRYMIGWMGYIINIFIFLIGLHKKNKTLIITTIIFQLYIFSLMALKSHLATMILASLVYLYLRKYKVLTSRKFIYFVSLLIFGLSFIDFIIKDDILEMLVTRRVFVIPSQLVYYHYEYFSTHPKTFWTYSIFSNFFEYPYNLPPPNLIGDVYFNKVEMTAVVNMFMEGYTALGYIGVFFVSMVFKFFLNIINYIYMYRAQNNIIVIVLLLGLSNVFNSTSLWTLLVTHGLIVLLLTISLYSWKNLQND